MITLAVVGSRRTEDGKALIVQDAPGMLSAETPGADGVSPAWSNNTLRMEKNIFVKLLIYSGIFMKIMFATYIMKLPGGKLNLL